jgi:hypothetical protein
VCSSVAYVLAFSNGTTLDTSVFTFSSSPLQYTISTSTASKVGTYTLKLTGSLDSAISTSTTFVVTLTSHCYGQTVSASSISNGTYYIAGTTLVQSLTAFTVSSGTCTGVTYTLKYTNGTSIDTSLFIFDATGLTLTTGTINPSYAGTYGLTLTGTLTGDTTYASSTFYIIVRSRCYG